MVVEKQAVAEISDAEWEVMRAVWTLGAVTSRKLIDVLAEKMGWKAATTKTSRRCSPDRCGHPPHRGRSA